MSTLVGALLKQTNVEDRLDFRDIDGSPLRIGFLVQYTVDRDETWNQNRWGIVTGVSSRGDVRVTPIQILTPEEPMWKNTEWFAESQKLRVIGR